MELLVAVTILLVVVVLLLRISSWVTDVWGRSMRRIEVFRDARAALRMMTEDLSTVYRQEGLPMVVFDNLYEENDPAGQENNRQVYALVYAPNTGLSDICSVGFYCAWDPEKNVYRLVRYFVDSDRTVDNLRSAGFDQEKRAYRTSDVFRPGVANETAETIAEGVWNLQATPLNAEGQRLDDYPIEYHGSELPAAIEISFDAVSPNAVRQLRETEMVSDYWFHPSSHLYESHIAPAMRRFETRVQLELSEQTSSTPTP